MAGKKRMRRSYLNDFRPGVGGDYVYTGAHYHFAGDAAELRSLRIRLGGAAFLAAAALLAAGLLPAPGATDRSYVILPWFAALTAGFVCVWKTLRLLSDAENPRAYVYSATAPKLPGWALAGALAGGTAFAAESVHLALFGSDGRTPVALGFLALLAVSAAAFLLLRRFLRGGRWTEQK